MLNFYVVLLYNWSFLHVYTLQGNSTVFSNLNPDLLLSDNVVFIEITCIVCRWQMTSRLLLLLVIATTTISHVAGSGAGRAFPIAAENFAVDNFKRINAFIVRHFGVLI